MSSRAITDHNGEYRARTMEMKPSSRTFVCGHCKGYHGLEGRKAMPSPSTRRKLFMCKVCIDSQTKLRK